MPTPTSAPPPEPIPRSGPGAGTSPDATMYPQDLTPDDFTRWMSYEALRRDFNPFNIMNEPADSLVFEFPFDLNNGPGIEDGAAMMTPMPPPDFASSSW